MSFFALSTDFSPFLSSCFSFGYLLSKEMVTLRFRIRQESLISAKVHRDSEGRVCLNAIESVSLLKDIVTLIPISAIGVTFSKFDGPINI